MSEKAINGVVYFWQWLLYTRVFGVVESPTTVYMRDDWEKLSDEKCSLRACRRRIPNRSRVVSCESRIVHMLYYLCLYSLYYYIELFTGGHTVFISSMLQMSIPPQFSLPQYISNLDSSRQKTIWNIWAIGIQLQYNIYIYNTLQYNIRTIWNTATGCLNLSWTW